MFIRQLLLLHFFPIERVTDNAFKLIQFVCIGIRMDSGIMRERADAAANGEVFPKLLTRKTFSLKRCNLFFEPRRIFLLIFKALLMQFAEFSTYIACYLSVINSCTYT